ncbi:regulatory particle non-ATPase [Savitreella phatthalungensis]
MTSSSLLAAYENGDTPTLIRLLEKSALDACKSGDAVSFQKSYSQLLPLYRNGAPQKPSKTRDTIVALHLLILLSESNLASFHSDVESLPEATLASAPVQWVVQIEQGLTEGSYHDVRKLLSSPPTSEAAAAFAHHTDAMRLAIRAEIADCCSASYTSLPLVNLSTLLLLPTTKETEKYAHERGWSVRDGRVIFPKTSPSATSTTTTDAQAAAMQLDGLTTQEEEDAKSRLITQTLGYARELESIV